MLDRYAYERNIRLTEYKLQDSMRRNQQKRMYRQNRMSRREFEEIVENEELSS